MECPCSFHEFISAFPSGESTLFPQTNKAAVRLFLLSLSKRLSLIASYPATSSDVTFGSSKLNEMYDWLLTEYTQVKNINANVKINFTKIFIYRLSLIIESKTGFVVCVQKRFSCDVGNQKV